MATLKALKAKEDAYRKELQDQVDAIFAQQELIIEDLHKILAEIEALSPKEEAKGKVKAK